MGYNEQYSTSKVQRKKHNKSRANMNLKKRKLKARSDAMVE